MNNLENVELEGRVRLSPKGYWSNDQKQIWINEARRLDDGRPVVAYLFHPKSNDQAIESAIQSIEKNKNLHKIFSGAQNIGNQVVPYAIFEAKPADKPDINKIEKPPIDKQGKKKGVVIPRWVMIVGIVTTIILGCSLIGVLGIPIIRDILQPPTPTITASPTPQIFTFVADTVVTNFITGESFVISKDSKVIIENPTHTECEVLANWNGTQIIIPAKIIFPDRTTCP
jgi:hypothetical protein